MEFDEQEEQEEELGIPEAPQPQATQACYDSLGNSAKLTGDGTAASGFGRKGAAASSVRYRECQKNHAVSFGGHAVDGCCEFMAAGEDGSLEAVICAACNCHRNFHRKEIDGDIRGGSGAGTLHHHRPQPPPPHLHQFSPYYHHRGPPYPAGYLHHLATPPMAQHRPLALPAAVSGGGLSRDEEDMSNPSSSGGGGGGGGGGCGSGSSKKRFRTKFTQEQKDKMLAFAEQVGWRIQKQDEAMVEQFCAEACVKRSVLKVWMHNNKNTLVTGESGGVKSEKANGRTN
ncbi:zinc-finger homeodomain protein 2 isoform X2 [Arachis hypogaea]|uniref:zinc-finger homeodomain protein 2 isoform X2 n=2 Tax=Arachis TaxID=3817 RepID=UPI000DED8AAA|nr:zinc-finger homeodomain protein 2 isoform X2 [Arachis hypogaea]QHN92632.1 Zinc-finger homeodomain protein [Arachis hypogaea]